MTAEEYFNNYKELLILSKEKALLVFKFAEDYAKLREQEAWEAARECVGDKYINGFSEALELCTYQTIEEWRKNK